MPRYEASDDNAVMLRNEASAVAEGFFINDYQLTQLQILLPLCGIRITCCSTADPSLRSG